MEALITLCYPAYPPQIARYPNIPKPPGYNLPFMTVANRLKCDPQFKDVDQDLIHAICFCQAWLPAYRPSLRDLVGMLEKKVAEIEAGETMQDKQRLMAWFLKCNEKPARPERMLHNNDSDNDGDNGDECKYGSKQTEVSADTYRTTSNKRGKSANTA